MPTDIEIFENRKKAIEFLKTPGLKRAKDILQSVKNPEARCCLGHMCVALDIHPVLGDYTTHQEYQFGKDKECAIAPYELRQAVGLDSGTAYIIGVGIGMPNLWGTGEISLAGINDSDRLSFHEIAENLERDILGGEDTVWKKITINEE